MIVKGFKFLIYIFAYSYIPNKWGVLINENSVKYKKRGRGWNKQWGFLFTFIPVM